MNKEALLRSEFIGRKCEVIGKSVKGKIIDETKNMIVLKTDDKIKKFIKKSNTFRIKTENKEHIIEGKKIQIDPVDRVGKIKIGE